MNLFELFVKIGVDDQATDKIKKVGDTAEKTAKGGLSNFASKLGKGLATAAKIGAAAVTAVGSGIAALGTYAAKVGGDFEAQMSKVSAISGATGDDLQALEDKAKQLGIDTKFSATEAGQAFEYMAMAGWKTEQMLDGVAGVMDLAAASGEDLALVSDIVTDAMTAFGMSADQSTHFADVLAQASSNANTNVALLGESFKYVAPVAGALGYSVEDTATALGLMANAGIKGSQAGTALRAALSSMLDASDPVYNAMIRLGLATEDTVTALVNEDGTSKSLAETMGILRDAFSELTEAEQAEYAANIFGREAMSGMLAIINTSDAEFEKLTNSIYSADGAAKQMADTMANNLQGQLTLLQSSAEGFGLALYDKVQVPLTELASWAVESLNELTTAFNENGVDGIVEATGNILSEAVTTVVDKLPEFVELAVSVIESFVNGLSQNQKTVADGAISIITTLATELLDMLPQIVALGLELIVSLASGIANSMDTLIPVIVDTILLIVDTLTDPDSLGELVEAALEIIVALAEGLIDAIPEIVEKCPEIIDNIIVALEENIPKIAEAGVKLFVSLVKNLPEILRGIVKAIPEIIRSILRGLGSLGEQLGGLFSSAWEGVKKVFSDVGSFFSGVWSSITGVFANVWSWFSGIGNDIVNGIKTGISNAWAGITKWFNDLWNGLIGGVKSFLGIASPSKLFADIGKNMALGVGVGWDDTFGDVEKDINTSLDFGEKQIDVKHSGSDLGSSGGKGVSVVQNIYSQAKTAADLMQEALYQQEMAVIFGV